MIKGAVKVLSRFALRQFQQAYYRTKESLGQHKRDLVVLRVEEASESLLETKAYFLDALECFKSFVNVGQNDLDAQYHRLKAQFDFCDAHSQRIVEKINAIEEVSEALFSEWEAELKQYSSRSLRAQSRQQLKQSRRDYQQLLKTMHKAQKKIDPVLGAFRDQVLFLKHNLNANAIAALEKEFSDVTMDISQLIQAMEISIAEANQFVTVLIEHHHIPALAGK